jgi:hypothetical protein
LAQNLFKQASQRITTGDLNRVVRQALEKQPPPMRQNRRAKVYYATQVATNPPTIVLFTNEPSLFDNTYQRYLLKFFRDSLPFAEVPIKLYLRRKRRDEQVPEEEKSAPIVEEIRSKESRKKPKLDVSALTFRTSVSDDEVKKESKHYESELWNDL